MPSEDALPWSPQHLFCVWTWSLLRDLQLGVTVFKDSKNITMEKLSFWNPSASAETNKVKASLLATKFDRLIIGGKLAGYEQGFSAAPAVAALTEILSNGKKTVYDLATITNSIYKFRDEQ